MAACYYPNGDLLVRASWRAQHLHDPNRQIIDARSAQDYAAGHFPRAVLLPNSAFQSTQGCAYRRQTQASAAVTAALARGHTPRVPKDREAFVRRPKQQGEEYFPEAMFALVSPWSI